MDNPKFRLEQQVRWTLDRSYHGTIISIYAHHVMTPPGVNPIPHPNVWQYLILLDQPEPPAKSLATQMWLLEDKIEESSKTE
jgi:hypothetical protein